MTKEEIAKIVMRGATGEYSHVLICCDTFDYEDYPVYVKYGENIESVVKHYNDYNKMSKVMEVYNYNLDLEMQLNEKRAYHIKPLAIEKKDVNDNDEKIILDTKKLNQNDEQKKLDIYISEKLKEAIEYATKMHKGQKRRDDTQYIDHPLRVLKNVLKYKNSKNLKTLLICACLHDTIEDTEATYYDIVEKFGVQVASIVLELTTDEDIKKALGKGKYLSIKMKNMSSWALVIKLCDRLDNIGDLENCNDEDFKANYINQTIDILDYLIKNLNLSKTHITIIEDIISSLLQLCKNDIGKITKLVEIFKNCLSIKNNLQKNNNEKYNKLLEINNYLSEYNSIDLSKKLIL